MANSKGGVPLLSDYVPPAFLDVAWENGGQFSVEAPESSYLVTVHGKTQEANEQVKKMVKIGEKDATVALLTTVCTHHFMKRGPVIIRATPEMCSAMADTELRIPITSYKIPYSIMGVALSKEAASHHHPAMVFVWRIAPNRLMAWTMSNTDGYTYHCLFADDRPTLEEQLIEKEGESPLDDILQVNGFRIALNLCLLAGHRPTTIDDLPKVVRQQRDANNRGLRRQAANHLQEVRFRDLVLRPMSLNTNKVAGGVHFKMGYGVRSGHWKRVAHGPKLSLRELRWVNPYEVHVELRGDNKPPTTIIS